MQAGKRILAGLLLALVLAASLPLALVPVEAQSQSGRGGTGRGVEAMIAIVEGAAQRLKALAEERNLTNVSDLADRALALAAEARSLLETGDVDGARAKVREAMAVLREAGRMFASSLGEDEVEELKARGLAVAIERLEKTITELRDRFVKAAERINATLPEETEENFRKSLDILAQARQALENGTDPDEVARMLGEARLYVAEAVRAFRHERCPRLFEAHAGLRAISEVYMAVLKAAKLSVRARIVLERGDYDEAIAATRDALNATRRAHEMILKMLKIAKERNLTRLAEALEAMEPHVRLAAASLEAALNFLRNHEKVRAIMAIDTAVVELWMALAKGWAPIRIVFPMIVDKMPMAAKMVDMAKMGTQMGGYELATRIMDMIGGMGPRR